MVKRSDRYGGSSSRRAAPPMTSLGLAPAPVHAQSAATTSILTSECSQRALAPQPETSIWSIASRIRSFSCSRHTSFGARWHLGRRFANHTPRRVFFQAAKRTENIEACRPVSSLYAGKPCKGYHVQVWAFTQGTQSFNGLRRFHASMWRVTTWCNSHRRF
jgi:hypothetical protein